MTTEHEAKRQGIIKGLRELADALEATPGLPTPYDVHTDLFWQLDDNASLAGRISQQDARAAMAALPGDWTKDNSGNYVSYDRSFGEFVTYSLNIDRADVCRRVQVGTRSVPAHDEPVYEWECGPETDVSTALAEHTQPAIQAIERAARQEGKDAAVDVMIAALDALPDPTDGLDPRTWREALDTGLIGNADVARAYNLQIVQADPFAGIPNSSDEENRPL